MANSSPSVATRTQVRHLRQGIGPAAARRLFAAFIGTSAGAVLTFALQFIAAHVLGSREFGKFAYALGLLTIASLLAPLGFQTTILKFLGQYKATGESQRAAAVIAFARRWTWFGAALALVAMASIGALTIETDRVAGWTLIVLACAVPFAAVAKLLVSILRSAGRTASAIYLEVPLREGLAALLLGILWCTSVNVHAVHLGVVYASSIVMSFVALSYASRAPVIGSRSSDVGESRREWISLTLSAFLLTGSNLLLRRFDVIIAGNVLGFEAAGVYAAAMRFGDLLQLPLVAANMIVAPKIAELHSAGKTRELAQLAHNTSKFSLALCAAGSIPFLLFPEYVLGIFGSEFRSGSTVLRAMTAGQLVNALTGCAGLLLTMTGHQWRAVGVMAIVGTLSTATNVLLATTWGMDAMGIGSGVGIAVWNVALLIAAYRAIGVWALPSKFGAARR